MRKSELLILELEKLNQEQEKVVKENVFYLEHKQEDHDSDWSKYWDTYGRTYGENKEQLQRYIRKEQNRELEIGDGATVCLYSDMHAATVIKKTKATITVQHDTAIKDPNFKPEWVPGGFSVHCTNQDEQKYTYEVNLKGQIEKFHWSEKHGRWQGGGDGSIILTLGRHEFYDYNF